MMSINGYTEGHRALLAAVAKAAGFVDPVAFISGEMYWTLLKNARKGNVIPLDGVLVRDWSASNRKQYPGLRFGARIYHLEGIRFVTVSCTFDHNLDDSAYFFVAVEKKNYLRLFRIVKRSERAFEEKAPPPVLPEAQRTTLWANTIGYLSGDNLQRIQALGGRPRRGILLTGEPGNGKTMACRWIWDECRRRGWEWRAVSPDAYRQARESCNRELAVRNLFTVQKRGVIFFDDMDLALRDRDTVKETEDQAVFLTALDGISVKEGVVYIFTTNCALGLIDRAFKRPGRIDVVLHLHPPDADLRRQLIQRWHPDIVAALDMDIAVAQTKGMSFAEIEEVKNLLIQHFLAAGSWDWPWARQQFRNNREEFCASARRHVGFGYQSAIAGRDV